MNRALATSAIDLTGLTEPLVISFTSSERAESTRELTLPPYERFCHVAADSSHFRWIGASNRMYPWVGSGTLASIFAAKDPSPPTVKSPNARALLILLELANGRHLCLLPLASRESCSWLEVQTTGQLVAGVGTLGTSVLPKRDVPVVACGYGSDPYEAIRTAWDLTRDPSIGCSQAALRSSKDYPTPFEYLGWCTWEQYKHSINEEKITKAIRLIEGSDVPIRWVLVDDGHQQSSHERMISLKPDSSKFPSGWEAITRLKQRDGVRWIGIWHTLLMDWGGIDAAHEMPAFAPFLMQHPSSDRALLPRNETDVSRLFYSEFIGAVKRDGFDFIKIDNMSRSAIAYEGTRSVAETHASNLLNLEAACSEQELGLLNCSAQNTIGIFNATHSAVMRTSPDYKKNNTASSKSQILQSVFNACWLGQTFWPDHDMFHSSDANVAETMAVTKAMSGGPIYLSDDPRDLRHDVVAPLCYEDGLLIRPVAPGVPTPDSLFQDALYTKGIAYKVVAPLDSQACAVAAYNLCLQDSVACGRITVEDYASAAAMTQPYRGAWATPQEGVVVYDWASKRGRRTAPNGLEFSIDGFGHRLFLMCPVREGWALIGRSDKYLSSSAAQLVDCDERSITVAMREPGPVVVYSASGSPRADGVATRELDNGFYEFDLGAVAGPNHRVTFRR